MRDLNFKNHKPPARNRAKRQRKPVNYRSFFKKGVRLVSWVVVVALVGVVGYEAYGVLARATFLKLERIEVTTLKRLTRQDVLTQAGVNPGDDMLSIRLSRIGEQLAKNPWVEKVKVRRYFPHTLIIDIVEREPVAVVNMGYLYYLDKNGEIFKPLTVGDQLDYPVLTGITEEDMGKDPSGSKEALKNVLELIALLKGGTVFALSDVSEIHYDKGYGFTLFSAQGGVPVRLGSSDFSDKLMRFARIYKDLQAQMPNLQYIDLDYSDKIIVNKS